MWMNASPILARTPATVQTQMVVTSASASKDLKGKTVRMVSIKLINIAGPQAFICLEKQNAHNNKKKPVGEW